MVEVAPTAANGALLLSKGTNQSLLLPSAVGWKKPHLSSGSGSGGQQQQQQSSSGERGESVGGGGVGESVGDEGAKKEATEDESDDRSPGKGKELTW